MAAVNTAVTNQKNIQVVGSSPTSLPNDLNSFYTRFETDNSTQLAETLTTLKPGDNTLTFIIITIIIIINQSCIAHF